MRLVDVETFREHVGAPDVAAVKTKLVQYLEEATIRIEAYLGASLAADSYVDDFYVDPKSFKCRDIPVYLQLSAAFVADSPAPVVTQTSGPADFSLQDTLDTGTYRVQSSAGRVKLIGATHAGHYMRVAYDAGFASSTEGTYPGTLVDGPIPEALTQAALVIAAKIRDRVTGTGCEDEDCDASEGIPLAARSLLDTLGSHHPSAYLAL